jgi:hypothetical protein
MSHPLAKMGVAGATAVNTWQIVNIWTENVIEVLK